NQGCLLSRGRALLPAPITMHDRGLEGILDSPPTTDTASTTCFTLGLSRRGCHDLNCQLRMSWSAVERPVPAVKPTCAVFPAMDGISIGNECVICVFKVRSFKTICRVAPS